MVLATVKSAQRPHAWRAIAIAALLVMLSTNAAPAALVALDTGDAGALGSASLLQTLSAPSSFTFNMAGRHSFDFAGDPDNETFVINAQPNTDYRILQVVDLELMTVGGSFGEESIINVRTPDNPGDTEITISFTGAGAPGTFGPTSVGPLDLSLSALSLITGPSGQIVVELFEINFDDVPDGIDGNWLGGDITFSTLDQPASVPEPSVAVMGLMGVMAMVARRRAC